MMIMKCSCNCRCMCLCVSIKLGRRCRRTMGEWDDRGLIMMGGGYAGGGGNGLRELAMHVC